MSTVNCTFQKPEQNTQAFDLTVGDIFYFVCQGEWPKLNPKAVELRVDKEHQYQLKLLNFEFKSATEARLAVTSYEVGEHKLQAVQLVDAENSVILGDLSFTVKSVMDPQNPAKEPLGPIGPLPLQLAPIYWMSLLIFVGLVVAYVGHLDFQKRQKKKLLAKMNVDQYSHSAIKQYYSSTRKLQRTSGIADGEELTIDKKKEFIQELEQSLQIYLARRFLVPTIYWSPRKVDRDLKRNHQDIYDSIRKNLRKLYAEFDRANKNIFRKSTGKVKTEISNRDCLQLMEMSRKFVEQIEALTTNTEAR